MSRTDFAIVLTVAQIGEENVAQHQQFVRGGRVGRTEALVIRPHFTAYLGRDRGRYIVVCASVARKPLLARRDCETN